MVNQTENVVSDRVLNDLARKGMAIYERLLPTLLAENENRYIAIHVDTEEYRIGTSMTKASRALGEAYPPDGKIFVRKIGEEPDYALSRRILAGEMMARAKK